MADNNTQKTGKVMASIKKLGGNIDFPPGSKIIETREVLEMQPLMHCPPGMAPWCDIVEIIGKDGPTTITVCRCIVV